MVPLATVPRAARLLLLALIVIGAFAAWHWRGVLDPLQVTAAVARYPAAPLGFIAVHVAASLLFVPRTLLAIVAGMLFGIGWGIVWAELGSVAGAAAGFLLARALNAGLIDLRRGTRIAPIPAVARRVRIRVPGRAITDDCRLCRARRGREAVAARGRRLDRAYTDGACSALSLLADPCLYSLASPLINS
jgi:hypothetical protein